MPELPEVETIRRVLEARIVGRRMEAVELRCPGIVAHPSPEEFCAVLPGQMIAGVERRGKFLSLRLQSGDALVLHLRMTGCLLAAPAGWPEEPHTHVVFPLDGGLELQFSDPRRFGRFWLLRRGEADQCTGRAELGIEPSDPALTGEYLRRAWGRSRKAVKTCLLEQHAVAGIGNIYSDEILFAAKLHPACPARELSPEEWTRLAGVIPERLAYFTEKNAVTPEEFLTMREDYRNTPFLQVYGRAGQPCPACGSLLERVVIGGRSSVFCPGCQKPRD